MSDEHLVEIVMPQMGISVAEATLIGWRKELGERVEMDEPICDISSDKVDSDVPAPAAGRLVELLVEVGQTVDVGTPIALFATDEVAGAPGGCPGQPRARRRRRARGRDRARRSLPRPAGEQRHSPVVARLAQELGVDLEKLVGTGAGGRIRREDVQAAADLGPQRPGADAAAGRSFDGGRALPASPTEPLSRMRKTIGEHMLRSLRTAATVTQSIEVISRRSRRGGGRSV